MKNLILGVMGLMFVFSGSAKADGPTEMPTMEAVQVKKIEIGGNFMPGPGPGAGPIGYTLIDVLVNTNGCTTANDFIVNVVPHADIENANTIEIFRIRKDRCKAFLPQGTMLQLKAEFAGFGQVFIANPVRVINKTVH